ncbi:MAG: PD-(D/E)XK nuclease family transposase [Catalinimonas sp.]
MERRYISMLSDYGFKTTFGNRQQTTFLRRALQALITAQTPIRHVRFLNNEVSGLTKAGRGGLFDMICEDERGRTFIVEMQLSASPHFIQRAKFYAFHRFNTLVQRGSYHFDDLTPIYVISLLAERTYPTDLYHQIVTLKNQRGEVVDDQITHVVVELAKYDKALAEVETDLDKLLYTMKTTHETRPKRPLPQFMQEGWIAEALETLKTANLTPEERMLLEIRVAGDISDRMAMEEAARRKVEKEVSERVEKEVGERVEKEVSERVEKEVSERVARQTREEAIGRMLRARKLSDAEIATFAGVDLSDVQAARQRLADEGNGV